MTDRLDQLDYYTLLGVTHETDEDAIRKAFRVFARKYHPDRFTRSHPEKRDKATAIYRRGSEALQVLTDPDARRLYDIALSQGVLRLTADQRDGAARIFKRQTQPQKVLPSFSSPHAKALYERAAHLVKSGDARGAWKALQEAGNVEPGNKLIAEALKSVERRLRGL